jgi:hypothetical protein
MQRQFIAAAIAALTLSMAVQAKEYPIGKPQIANHMEVGAVYLQPIRMEPEGMMLAANKADVHLEADIHATKGNPNGFGEGEWVPYLNIRYELTKVGSGKVQKGDFMPMVANDGPHYGDNVKLMGPGTYKLKYYISAPNANPDSHFGRHTDKETGVAPWFKPFELDYTFTYAGIGKKGGY